MSENCLVLGEGVGGREGAHVEIRSGIWVNPKILHKIITDCNITVKNMLTGAAS